MPLANGNCLKHIEIRLHGMRRQLSPPPGYPISILSLGGRVGERAGAARVARRRDPTMMRPRGCADAPGESLMTLKASRRGLVPPFIAMDVLREANAREAAGERVIHLEVGQPGTPAPLPVLDAARRTLADDRIGYSDAL